MNKWRDSCVRSNDSLRAKFERADKDFQVAKTKLIDKKIDSSNINEDKSKDLYKRMESMAQDT